MSSLPFIRIEKHDYNAHVYFNYDETVVRIIKTVPGKAWDKLEKRWTIPASQVQVLKNTLESYGYQVSVTGDQDDGPSRLDLLLEVRRLRRENQRLESEKSARGADWADQLMNRCSPELAEKVFRALTRVLHPDGGGDSTLQRDLNVARDRTGVRR